MTKTPEHDRWRVRFGDQKYVLDHDPEYAAALDRGDKSLTFVTTRGQTVTVPLEGEVLVETFSSKAHKPQQIIIGGW